MDNVKIRENGVLVEVIVDGVLTSYLLYTDAPIVVEKDGHTIIIRKSKRQL